MCAVPESPLHYFSTVPLALCILSDSHANPLGQPSPLGSCMLLVRFLEANLQVRFILVEQRDVLLFRTMGVLQSIPTAHGGLQDGSAIPRTSSDDTNLSWREMLPLPLLLDTIPLMQRAAKALRPKHSSADQTLHDLLMFEFLAEFDAMATVLVGLLLTVENKNKAGLFAAQIDKLVCLLNELLHKDLESKPEIEVSLGPILGNAYTLTE